MVGGPGRRWSRDLEAYDDGEEGSKVSTYEGQEDSAYLNLPDGRLVLSGWWA